MNLFQPIRVYISNTRTVPPVVRKLFGDHESARTCGQVITMISPNPYPQPEAPQPEAGYDELDRLVQRALKALVCEQHPPERVWKRIRVELEQEKSTPNRFQISWLPLVLQPALTMSLIVLGAIGLQISSTPHDIRTSSRPSLTPPVATDYVEDDLTSDQTMPDLRISGLEGGD